MKFIWDININVYLLNVYFLELSSTLKIFQRLEASGAITTQPTLPDCSGAHFFGRFYTYSNISYRQIVLFYLNKPEEPHKQYSHSFSAVGDRVLRKQDVEIL